MIQLTRFSGVVKKKRLGGKCMCTDVMEIRSDLKMSKKIADKLASPLRVQERIERRKSLQEKMKRLGEWVKIEEK